MTVQHTSILVVDDELNNRDLLVRRLRREGYGVAEAYSGARAMEMMEVQQYDLVLLDLLMPEVDGYEVLRRVRSSPRLCDTEVIVLTAVQERDAVSACLGLGAVEYLVKPVDMISLKTRIWRCLESRRLRTRLGSEFEHFPDGMAVLIVDDNPLNRELLAVTARRSGCEVVCAESGVDALELLGQRAFDAVLLDVMMPEMDGYSVLQRVREVEGGANLAVIMISALDRSDVMGRCFELGADDYITKPFRTYELQSRVHTCVEFKRLQAAERRRLERLQELATLGRTVTRDAEDG